LNIVTQDSVEADSTPSYQVRSHQRETTQKNNARILTSVGGFDHPPSPLESLSIVQDHLLGSSSDSEGIHIVGNIPVGGEGNPPPNPQLPWLRTTTVVFSWSSTSPA